MQAVSGPARTLGRGCRRLRRGTLRESCPPEPGVGPVTENTLECIVQAHPVRREPPCGVPQGQVREAGTEEAAGAPDPEVGRPGDARGVPARGGRVRLRLRRHRHPGPQRGLRDADHDGLLRRRQDRAGSLRGAEPDQHLAVRGAAARAGRRDRRRGPHLLHQQGDRPQGHPARGLQQRARQRDAGRLHDHPAVRQDLLPVVGPHHHPQGEGGVPVTEAAAHPVEERDPPGLPEHHLLRARGLRHPGRRPGLLRQGRQGPHRPGGCGTRGDPQLAGELRPR